MEQDDLVPFSCLISSMLLLKVSIKPIDIVNTISGLSTIGTIVDDEDDELSVLSNCVEMDFDCSFRLKQGCYYDTVLDDGITVKDFLIF